VVSEQVGPVRPKKKILSLVCDKYVNTVDTCFVRLDESEKCGGFQYQVCVGLFPLGNFRGRKFFKWGRVVTPRFLILVY
jgi:hypothetical protein